MVLEASAVLTATATLHELHQTALAVHELQIQMAIPLISHQMALEAQELRTKTGTLLVACQMVLVELDAIKL
jgi:hypothetical protein